MEPIITRQPFSVGTLLLGAGFLAAALFGAGAWVFETFLASQLPVDDPRYGTVLLCGIAVLLLFAGSTRLVTTFDPSNSRITTNRIVLFALPVLSTSMPFARVKAIDFHHPSDGNLPGSQMQMMIDYAYWRSWWVFRESLGEAQPYELYLETRERDRILLTRGYGRDRMADLGQKLAAMTHTRMT